VFSDPGAVDLRDVRMIQCREPALACKPREPVWIRSKRLRQDFDGDVAVQRFVMSDDSPIPPAPSFARTITPI
jgi:hypothetical protein